MILEFLKRLWRPKLFGPEMLADPYPFYARLRARAPVCWVGEFGGWVVTRYADVAAIFRSPQLNFDAYVLHTHNSSLVTVGVFDSERDPRLQTMQERLAKLKFDVAGGTDEQLMSPPMPIPVPRAK